MRNFIYVFLIVAAYFGFKEVRKYRTATQPSATEQSKIVSESLKAGGAQLSSAGIPTNCVGKEICITVFVAPWCPACHYSEPTFHAFQKYLPKNRPDIGFGVVIGASTAEENEKKKSELAPVESYADNTNQIMKLRQINAFPTWVITNAEGKEIHRQGGGIQVTQEAQVAQALAAIMGKN